MADTFFSGSVHSVIYENPESGWYVLSMVLDKEDTGPISFGFDEFSSDRVVVKGQVPGLRVEIGTWFGFEGRWENNKKYGQQIAIRRAPVMRGKWSPDHASKLLAANGVGLSVLRSIRDQVGEDEFLTSLSDVERLKKLSGINAVNAEFVVSRWNYVRALFQSLQFLAELDVPKARVGEIWSTFGDQTTKILSTDPWSLVRVNGITFSQADQMARKLALDMKSPLRVDGAVRYTCLAQRGMGHLYLTPDQMLGEVSALVSGTPPSEMLSSLVKCYREGTVVLDRDTFEGVSAIYEPWFYEVEKESAEWLARRFVSAKIDLNDTRLTSYVRAIGQIGHEALEISEEILNGKGDYSLRDLARAAVNDWGDRNDFVLTDDQSEGVVNALSEPVSILTGLPGTGKTSCLKAAVQILQEAGVKLLLVAPTGIAAKRLSSLTLAKASTIHRAFGAKGDSSDGRKSTYKGIVGRSAGASSDGSESSWEYHPDHPHPAEIIFIDESSMVDQALLYRVLSCTSPKCRVVFIGDAAQLPSVGPGRVLRDLVESDQFPMISLTKIFRQEDASGIVHAAHAIHAGKVPEGDKDFVFMEAGSDEEILEIILKLSGRLFSRQQGTDKKKATFQVLSPRHGGTLGVTNLNDMLRDLINPRRQGVPELNLGGSVVREGDRIMVTRNNYRLEVFNGDLGKISRIVKKDRVLRLKIHGPPVSYVDMPLSDVIAQVRLAYACTIHKSQGQEYDVVILPLVKSFGRQLQRNLLYTAVTRAKKRVFLIGHRSALASAVGNDREQMRNTLFQERLALSLQEHVVPARNTE